MFDRLISILKSIFNKNMAKLETPEVLAEQAEMELESNVKKITEALTQGIANEKLLEGKVKKAKEDLALWEKRALAAVQQNNDDLARQCLAKKQEFAESVQSMEAQIIEQRKNNQGLKERHTELQTKLRDFRAKKSEMTARMNATDTLTKTNQLISGAGSAGTSSMDKWEQKIAEKEAMSQAMREMSQMDSGASGASEADFRELDKKAGLDAELLLLKASVNTGPKLIEATDDSSKDIVDAEEVKPAEENDGKN